MRSSREATVSPRRCLSRSRSAIWRWYSGSASKARFASAMEFKNPEMFSFVMALFLCDGIIVPSRWGKKGTQGPARCTGGCLGVAPAGGGAVVQGHPELTGVWPYSLLALVPSAGDGVSAQSPLWASVVSQPSLLAQPTRWPCPLSHEALAVPLALPSGIRPLPYRRAWLSHPSP